MANSDQKLTTEQACPSCGYTKADAQYNMDHQLCKNAGNAPWETSASQKASEGEPAQELCACGVCGCMVANKSKHDQWHEMMRSIELKNMTYGGSL